MELIYVIMVLAVVLYGGNIYLTKRNDKKALENELRMQALELFLYAEKQNLIGEEKMNLVVEKILERVDGTIISTVVNGTTLRNWLQALYDEVKAKLQEEIK